MKTLLMIFQLTVASIALSQSGRYVVLDTSQASAMMQQCSRWTPDIQGNWIPSSSNIQSLEDTLGCVSRLVSKTCCYSGKSIERPKEFLRQYLGIIVNGKKLIYVNAFPLTEFEDYPPGVKPPDWHKVVISICDGGPDVWGVLYDPRDHTFSDLAINGVA
jgi:hypothetical protein